MKRYEYNYGKNPEGALSTISGYATETTNFGETAFGILNKSTRDEENFTTPEVVSSSTATLFSVGNGTDHDSRKNIIELKADGTVYINGVGQYDGTNPGEATDIADEFQGIHDDITGLNEDVDRIDNTIESIHISEDDKNLIYTLLVDGQERGTINIPRDQFLKNVSYNEETNNLEFTFIVRGENNEEVEKQVNVNMTDLEDIYSAGDGLNLENKQFSVKVDADTQPYIEVSSNGVKIIGINEALDKKVSWDESKKVITLPADGSISALRNNGLEGGVLICQRTYDDGATYVTEVGTTKNNLTLNSIERPKIDFADGTSQNVAYQSEITDISSSLDNYLPLSGGTLTGNVEMENAGLTINHGNLIVQDGLNGQISMYPNAGMISLIAGSVSNTMRIQKDISLAQGGYYPIAIDYSSEHPCIRINQKADGTFDFSLTKDGITIKDKTETDLLNAAGGTTSISDIIAKVPQPDLSPYATKEEVGSNTYTGANYISKETNLTDAVLQLDTEIKATNDNLALEHTNAEATYAKKTELGNYLRKDITELTFGDNSNPLLGSYIIIREPRDGWTCFTISHNGDHLSMDGKGITIIGKGPSYLLNAAGGTVSIQDIISQVTVPTKVSELTNDSGYQTEAQVAAKVSALVDSAPETLDTLNELAAALGDDPNFATTVTNQIAQKADKTTATTSADGLMSAADKAKLDSITIQDGDIVASGFRINDGTANEVLTANGNSNTLKTIDGQTLLGSGDVDMSPYFKLDNDNYVHGKTYFVGDTTITASPTGSTSALRINADDVPFIKCRSYNFNPVTISPNKIGVVIYPTFYMTAAQGNAGDSPNYQKVMFSLDRDEDGLTRLSLGNFDVSEDNDIIRGTDSYITSNGITLPSKSSSDLLHAAGGTTTLKTINGESLLGSGDIITPTPTVNAASGTKTIWTGTQSEYEGVSPKDTNTLYFITEE